MTLFGFSDQDFWHHLALGLIILLGILLFFAVSPSKGLQFAIGLLTACSYVAWGYFHHKADSDYHFKSMIEYVLIATLGVLILGGVLL